MPGWDALLACRDGHCTATGHGIPCVYREIEKSHFKLVRIDLNQIETTIETGRDGY